MDTIDLAYLGRGLHEELVACASPHSMRNFAQPTRR